MEDLKNKIRKFSKERNWDQFHSPKNLTMALAGEVGELVEIFQWLKEEESKQENISKQDMERTKQELADILIYLVRIADKLNIDLLVEANKKMDLNAQKYPVDLSIDNAIKYNRRDE